MQHTKELHVHVYIDICLSKMNFINEYICLFGVFRPTREFQVI